MTINHAEQAQRFLDAGRDYDLRKAQVHATLAVAAEQRTANLIAMFRLSVVEADGFATEGFSYPQALIEIREGLGL